ncbi:SDR family NAD(P)-dependent oxidoreductase [bacterium CPR1]|nr:SDR family NAD(P)-dependent oxidoreductase [bacterium CPR1]
MCPELSDFQDTSSSRALTGSRPPGPFSPQSPQTSCSVNRQTYTTHSRRDQISHHPPLLAWPRRHLDLSRRIARPMSGAVFITGASAGIGAACARAFAREGRDLILVARRLDRLEQLKNELGSKVRVDVFGLDVTDRQAVIDLVQSQAEVFERTEILLNNAGMALGREPLHAGNPEDWDRMLDLNVKGFLYVLHAVLPILIRRGTGHVVNLSSAAGHYMYPNGNVYAASKFAVVGLSESLTAEVAALGIRVSLVDPGPTQTSFTAARGVPFQRKYPRPLPAARVAEAVIDVVEHDRYERVLPRWLRIAPLVRAVMPDRFRAGMIRDFRDQSGELAQRWRAR